MNAIELASYLLEGFKEKKAQFVAAGADPAQVDEVFAKYKELKNRHLLTQEELHIDSYETFEILVQVVNDASQRQSKSQRTKLENPRSISGMKVVSNNSKAIVVVPKDWKEATIAGQGTKWCVAMTVLEPNSNTYPGQGHWDRYMHRKVQHYMAQIKGRPSPWVEDHQELGPGERPPAEVTCWKLGMELGPAATEGGPGKYVFVPDIEYKVVYSSPPEHEARDSTDAVIPVGRFLKLTGMSFNDFGKDAWKVADKAGVPFDKFADSVTPEIWDAIGQTTQLKHVWTADEKQRAEFRPEQMEDAWIVFWREVRSDVMDRSDPRFLEYLGIMKSYVGESTKSLATELVKMLLE